MVLTLSYQIFCSPVNLFNWLQNHLLPCPFKSLTGFDCPGCGFQRAFIFLIKGNLSESWQLYPPTIPIISLLLFAAISYFAGFKTRSKAINIFSILVGNFILLSYFYKMAMH